MLYSYTVDKYLSNIQCQDCDFHVNASNVQALAKIHAKKYGHKVVGELAVIISYNGREHNASSDNLNLQS